MSDNEAPSPPANPPQATPPQATAPETESAPDASEGAAKAEPVQVDQPPHPVSAYVSDTSEQDSVSTQRRWHDVWRRIQWLAAFNLATLAISAIGAVVGYFELQTLHESNRQTAAAVKLTERALQAAKEANDIAARAADATETQARLTLDQLKQGSAQVALGRRANAIASEASRLERRAWITVKDAQLVALVPGLPATVQLHVTNSGATPALRTSIASTVVGRQQLTLEVLNGPIGQRNHASSSMVIPPGSVMTVFPVTSEVLNDAHLANIRSGAMRLFALGTIFYDDIFGNSHQTDFCFAVGREELNLRPADPKIQSLVACPEHNDAR